MKRIFSRNSVSKMGVLCSPLEGEEGTLQMWLMQKGPSGSDAAIPRAPGSHFSVRKHLHSKACLQIQWSPQTCIFPSLTALAKCCQFLESSAALGSDGCSPLRLACFLVETTYSQPKLGRLLAHGREMTVVPVLCEVAAPTASSELHLVCKFKSTEVSQDDVGSATHLVRRALLNCYIITNVCPSLLKSRANVITVI